MSTAVPPLPSEAEQPGLSEPQRIINTFFSPSKTFEDIRRNASWWAPWLLVSLALMAFAFAMEKKVGFDAIVRRDIQQGPEFAQKALEQLSPEDREKAINRQVAIRRVTSIYFAGVAHLVGGMIIAALLMVIFNFGLEAGVSFKTSLAVLFYSWLPKLVFCALAVAVLFKGVDPDAFDWQNPVATNLGVLVDPTSSGKFLYHLLAGIDIFAIWEICLLGIGFSKQSPKKVSTTTGIVVVASAYFVFLLGRAALPF